MAAEDGGYRIAEALEEHADRLASVVVAVTAPALLRSLGKEIDSMRRRAIEERRRAGRHATAADDGEDEEVPS